MIRAAAGVAEKFSTSAGERPFPARLLEYSTRTQVYTRCQATLGAGKWISLPLEEKNHEPQRTRRITKEWFAEVSFV
jgi:hypothetical protein